MLLKDIPVHIRHYTGNLQINKMDVINLTGLSI